MKKPKKSTMTNKLDKLLSQIVRARGYCVHCNNTETLQAAHIFSRNNRSVRWDMNNVLCLCSKCHFWGHMNPLLFAEWVRDWMGLSNYTDLKLRANSRKQWTIEEMQELAHSFQNILEGKFE